MDCGTFFIYLFIYDSVSVSRKAQFFYGGNHAMVIQRHISKRTGVPSKTHKPNGQMRGFCKLQCVILSFFFQDKDFISRWREKDDVKKKKKKGRLQKQKHKHLQNFLWNHLCKRKRRVTFSLMTSMH